MIVGRVVNFSEVLGKTATQPKARGWHNVLVRDDSGVLQVCVLLHGLWLFDLLKILHSA